MHISEHIIVATDGDVSYKIEFIKRCEVMEIDFTFAQMLLKGGCRLVELNSKQQVYDYARHGFKHGFPSDESNWDFFSK